MSSQRGLGEHERKNKSKLDHRQKRVAFINSEFLADKRFTSNIPRRSLEYFFVSLAAVSLGENMWWPTSTRSGGVWCRSAGRKKGSADLGLRTFGTPRRCRQPPQHRSGGRGGGPGGRGGGRGGGRRGRGGGPGGRRRAFYHPA